MRISYIESIYRIKYLTYFEYNTFIIYNPKLMMTFVYCIKRIYYYFPPQLFNPALVFAQFNNRFAGGK